MPDQTTARDAVTDTLLGAIEPLRLALLEHGVMLGDPTDIESAVLAALGIPTKATLDDIRAAIVAYYSGWPMYASETDDGSWTARTSTSGFDHFKGRGATRAASILDLSARLDWATQ